MIKAIISIKLVTFRDQKLLSLSQAGWVQLCKTSMLIHTNYAVCYLEEPAQVLPSPSKNIEMWERGFCMI